MNYFDKAKNISYLSDFKQVHIGCIAVYKKHIIGIGYNTNKTHPLQFIYNKYRDLEWNGIQPKAKLHAEMMCLLSIKNLSVDFSKVKLYIYREDKNGQLALSKPCKACIRAIKDLGIKEINYTDYNGYVKVALNCKK
jgi:deoxycytidylate deaminase